MRRFYEISEAGNEFEMQVREICQTASELEGDDLGEVVSEIHVIPESIPHDSSAEKLYAKLSDAVVSRLFVELGLKSRVVAERSDSADVVAQSSLHGYSVVADSKVFRLSRSAKNQKDFKVGALSTWRGDHDHAALVAPLYQYPSQESQIYAQSLDHKVALLSFEHLRILLMHGVRETPELSLKSLFSFPEEVSRQVSHAERKQAIYLQSQLSNVVAGFAHISKIEIGKQLRTFMLALSTRARFEIEYWEVEMTRMAQMSKEEAIAELIAARKIPAKIHMIRQFVVD